MPKARNKSFFSNIKVESESHKKPNIFWKSNGKSPQLFILLCVCLGSSFNGVKDLLFQMINRYFFDFWWRKFCWFFIRTLRDNEELMELWHVRWKPKWDLKSGCDPVVPDMIFYLRWTRRAQTEWKSHIFFKVIFYWRFAFWPKSHIKRCLKP